MQHSYIPCDALKAYISSIAIYEQNAEQVYKVLPGTGIVIGFQFRGRLSQLHRDGEAALSPSGITGIHDSYKTFKNAPGTGSILVYFKDSGAAHFFRQPLHELFRDSVSLDNFMLRSELLVIEEQLHAAADNEARVKVVEDFLLARMLDKPADQLVLAALALIYKHKGDIRMAELARQLYTSQSPLEKRFRQAVGASPKKFSTIVRLKHAIGGHRPGDDLTGLGNEAGFYDQSHFIREFTTFTGETPGSFFSRG